MEEALELLMSQEEEEGNDGIINWNKYVSKDWDRAKWNEACQAFVHALRSVEEKVELPPTVTNSASIEERKEEEEEEEEEENKTVGSAEWLYNLCSTVPDSVMDPSHLAIAVLSAIGGSTDDASIQAALFDALGEGERAIAVMFELVSHIAELRKNVASGLITSERIRQIENTIHNGGTLSTAATAAAAATTTTDPEEDRRMILRMQAEEAISIAEAARHAAFGGSHLSGPAHATHSVTRASDVHAQKLAKKATKQAERALIAAKDAGAILDSEYNHMRQRAGANVDANRNQRSRHYDDEELRREAQSSNVGIDGMSRQQIWEMQQNLAPEGTRHYYKEKGLPPGTERELGEGYEMVTIPAPRRDASALPTRIVLDDVMSGHCRKAFGSNTHSLNPMQSKVFQAAFHTHENLLICAPTGAGKTNVAMLTVVSHFRDCGIFPNDNDPYAAYSHIDNQDGSTSVGRKIVYIAPMKALAQEVVEKFSSKLRPLGIVVRELTGDMQLTKAEADRADIIVTTPEKWDVVTRKGGDGSLAQTCGLLIIDEVHLLADDRGAVIESVVARLHRLVETTQRQVRIVGLSATLPNYRDVAVFLRVHETRGLFYFGPEYRPVPLLQQFVGVTEVKDRHRRDKIMNDVCYDIVVDSLRRGYQVMVFVHSRRGTGETARALTERAQFEGELEQLFVTMGTESNGEAHSTYSDRATKSRNKELTEHFHNGMGIHHAGMLRNDRKLTEQMFSDGAIKVLCCTATLAWGINLPAHTVVVKGTEVYNPEKGKAVDLSILDVMQIFGRAGRPQFDTSGEATLITSHDALARYLDKLVRAVPIESNFVKQLPDHLNAEIVGGTVTNIREAAEWLTYTYLHVRMCRNPIAYGISLDEKADDPTLRGRSAELVRNAATLLDEHRMIRYDSASGNLAVTDLGRVASQFYIRAESVAIFNQLLGKDNMPRPTDADLAHVICCATEFENVKVRAEELGEVDKLKKSECPLPVRAPVEEFSGKCCVLMQAYISNAKVNSFTLISDTNYIASNAGRVARALFEMCLRQGLAGAASKLLRLAKSIDKRLWWFQTPLRQFMGELPNNVFRALEGRKIGEKDGYSSFDAALSLLDMQPQEVGQLCHWFKGGERVQRMVQHLPRLEISCTVQPLTRGILRIHVDLEPKFTWHGRWHGGAEGFWLTVEDGENNRIYHHEYILFSRRTHPDPMELDLTIPAFDPLPPQYYIRVMSDSWVGCEMLVPVSFRHLLLPHRQMPYTDLMDLTPLPTSALHEPKFEQLYNTKFDRFNPIQTQLFHVLYHTDTPVLLGAPTGSGKTIVAEIAILRMKNQDPKAKCVYIAPLKSLARERLKEWRARLGAPPLKWTVLELSGDTRHDSRAINNADILVCTPEKWDLITRGWRGNSETIAESPASTGKRFIQQVRLLVIDEIHLLGEDRGAVLEALVSRTRFISRHVAHEGDKDSGGKNSSEPIRIMGLSTALANPDDLGDWIGIDVDGRGPSNGTKTGLYNFRPSVRPIPMEVHIRGFPGRHYCPRMATMNKPCYGAIKEHSPTQPVIIFVASRRQTRLTAMDLISYAAGDENPHAFLGTNTSEDYMTSVSESIRDESLRHTLTFGIGLHHAGLSSDDREIVERMFLSGDIRVLVATATLAWGVNLPAHLVIVKGTEFFDGKTSRYVDYPVTDVLQMMGRAGRPQFDTKGIACVMVAESKKNFYKKFLYEPFPVESCLGKHMFEHLNAEIAIGTINSVLDGVGYLNWTFFARRVRLNPSYYGAKSGKDSDVKDFFFDTVKQTLSELRQSNCIEIDDDGQINDDSAVKATILGIAASNFYLDYRTPMQMKTGSIEARDIFTSNTTGTSDEDEVIEDIKTNSGQTELQCRTFTIPSNLETAVVANLLFSLSKTHEFDELPVRHNEEQLNSELSERLPWGPDTRSLMGAEKAAKHRPNHVSDVDDIMSDPHTKCFLLLQAYITREKLPISDYINDTKSVVDQIPRLLAAMQYISTDNSTLPGNFDLLSVFAKLRQILNTRTMVNENPLCQIPGVTKESVQKLKNRGIQSIGQLKALSEGALQEALKPIFNNKRKHASLSLAIDFLDNLPEISISETKVQSQIEKSTGEKSVVGSLKFTIKMDNYRSTKEKSARAQSHHRLRTTSSENSEGANVMLVLGTANNSVLLAHKTVQWKPLQQSPSSSLLGPVELNFDWKVANDYGGTVILRFLLEHIRGMDLEWSIPLKQQ